MASVLFSTSVLATHIHCSATERIGRSFETKSERTLWSKYSSFDRDGEADFDDDIELIDGISVAITALIFHTDDPKGPEIEVDYGVYMKGYDVVSSTRLTRSEPSSRITVWRTLDPDPYLSHYIEVECEMVETVPNQVLRGFKLFENK